MTAKWWGQRWSGEQWVDRHGRTWVQDGSGKWWRNGLSTYEMLTFDPSKRRPPREFGPYSRAVEHVVVNRITDLWVRTFGERP